MWLEPRLQAEISYPEMMQGRLRDRSCYQAERDGCGAASGVGGGETSVDPNDWRLAAPQDSLKTSSVTITTECGHHGSPPCQDKVTIQVTTPGQTGRSQPFCLIEERLLSRGMVYRSVSCSIAHR